MITIEVKRPEDNGVYNRHTKIWFHLKSNYAFSISSLDLKINGVSVAFELEQISTAEIIVKYKPSLTELNDGVNTAQIYAEDTEPSTFSNSTTFTIFKERNASPTSLKVEIEREIRRKVGSGSLIVGLGGTRASVSGISTIAVLSDVKFFGLLQSKVFIGEEKYYFGKQSNNIAELKRLYTKSSYNIYGNGYVYGKQSHIIQALQYSSIGKSSFSTIYEQYANGKVSNVIGFDTSKTMKSSYNIGEIIEGWKVEKLDVYEDYFEHFGIKVKGDT